MSYVVVEDVAASWEQYRRFADALAGPAPAGLILHAAGPTDEGFRIVGVWESEEAWLEFAGLLAAGADSSELSHVLRALRPEHVIYGRGREEL
ncbi:MAG TPA: hypothetical protein VFR32_11720 [Gaiellaceae bacterium]|nr:hypothetical protein [Gaiellaceae bacterium]